MFDERKIYKYIDPETQQEKWDDPLRIHRQMREFTNGQLRYLLKMINEAEDKPPTAENDGLAHPQNVKEGAMAEGLLIEAARKTFGLPEFDPDSKSGIVDQDVLDLVNHWIDWTNQKKSSGS